MAAKTYLIHNKLFDETFAAHIEKNGTGWVGLVPDIPEIKCHGNTVEAVEQELPKEVNLILIREENDWETRFKEDVKAGRLDHLIEKSMQNINEGKYTKLAILS